jgi:lipopolysaccharide biosynthesis glycosyltransferase
MQAMTYGLDEFGRNLEFWVLVGADDSVYANGVVRGRWNATLRVWNGQGKRRSMTEEFLNCSGEPAAILKFTKKYGPLDAVRWKEEDHTWFEFKLKNWRDSQQRLANVWRSPWASPTTASASHLIKVDSHERFAFKDGKLSYQCSKVYRFMQFELTAYPGERRKVCNREGCAQKFLATDLKEKYCSDRCSAVAKRESKLAHWNRHKKSYLAKRKAKRSKGET